MKHFIFVFTLVCGLFSCTTKNTEVVIPTEDITEVVVDSVICPCDTCACNTCCCE